MELIIQNGVPLGGCSHLIRREGGPSVGGDARAAEETVGVDGQPRRSRGLLMNRAMVVRRTGEPRGGAGRGGGGNQLEAKG